MKSTTLLSLLKENKSPLRLNIHTVIEDNGNYFTFHQTNPHSKSQELHRIVVPKNDISKLIDFLTQSTSMDEASEEDIDNQEKFNKEFEKTVDLAKQLK